MSNERLVRNAALPVPYYEDGAVRLYLGDCRELLPFLEGDAVVTDPPYGIGKAEWDGALPLDVLYMAAALVPVVAVQPGVWNLGVMPAQLGRLTYRWTLASILVNGMTRGSVGFGNWIPTMLYALPEVPLHRPESDTQRAIVGREEKPDHPSPKPITVMRWVIDRIPGQTIIDPFAGSGSTLRAAKEAGRKAIGIEIDPDYCAEAARLLSQETLGLAS